MVDPVNARAVDPESHHQVPLVSVVICTRDRKADLAVALRSVFAQRGVAYEVLVLDDASTDGTIEMLARDFPDVRVIAKENHGDVVALRNEGYALARGTYVVTIDDDAYFTSPKTLAHVAAAFAADAEVAAIGMSYMEPSYAASADHRPLIDGTPLRHFKGCAHAARKDCVCAVKGYREFFVHQGEERDLCIRLQQRGYRVIYLDVEPVIHTISRTRDQGVMDYYGVRNTLLFDCLNLPLSMAVLLCLGHSWKLYWYSWTWATAFLRMRYLVWSWGACIRFSRFREPVSAVVYRRYRALAAHVPLRAVCPPPGPAG
jgi:glycosyltransferase involved in cell wall biosynthesis